MSDHGNDHGACVLCAHAVADHNLQVGCLFCRCAATPGEASYNIHVARPYQGEILPPRDHLEGYAPPPPAPTVMELLAIAEAELLEWATGKRSWINEMMNTENYVDQGNGTTGPDRNRTLALTEARDADAIRAAREKVLALRLLAGLTPEGVDPMTVVAWGAGHR